MYCLDLHTSVFRRSIGTRKHNQAICVILREVEFSLRIEGSGPDPQRIPPLPHILPTAATFSRATSRNTKGFPALRRASATQERVDAFIAYSNVRRTLCNVLAPAPAPITAPNRFFITPRKATHYAHLMIQSLLQVDRNFA